MIYAPMILLIVKVQEKIYNKPFPNTRPQFLYNPVTQALLELDCYNESEQLAIEYNGEQHYKYIEKFYKNYESFLCQKYRDEIKIRLCKENNITLIVVPYTVRISDIESYITKSLNA